MLPITSDSTVAACANLPLRDGDVFIASFPKSGTTWMQHIVHTLATDGNSPLPHISDACPFFEVDRTWDGNGQLTGSVQANHAKISRRCFNTHLRWSMMPKSHPGARYVYMTRSATDACVSFYHHLAHQAVEDGGFPGSLNEFVTEWTNGRAPFGSWSAHLKSWLCGEAAADPRVLIVAYEDLKADLRGCVGRVNAHCGFGLSEARLDELLPGFEFEWMRKNEDKFHPRSVRWVRRDEDKEDFHFIRAGRVGDGKAFSPTQKQELAAMMARTFPEGAATVPEQVARLVAV